MFFLWGHKGASALDVSERLIYLFFTSLFFSSSFIYSLVSFHLWRLIWESARNHWPGMRNVHFLYKFGGQTETTRGFSLAQVGHKFQGKLIRVTAR